MALEQHLLALKDECTKRPLDRAGILRALENVLAYLVLPENNSDANCKRADLFVTLEIDEIVEFDPPDDVGRILHDMMILHDTHTAPEIAKNFEATPDRLLERTRQALANLAC